VTVPEGIDPARRAFLRGRLFSREGQLEAQREQGASLLAVLSQSACLAWNDTFCMSCQQACPDEAIHLDQRMRPTIIDDACTGCGDCIPVCPTEAIRAEPRKAPPGT